MTSTNPDSLDNQDQFHARILPTQNKGGHWHKPGNEQGNEAVPEFHAQTYPPGTAPAESTFQPHPEGTLSTPAQGNPVDYPSYTSKDIHNAHGYEEGRPMQGQTSRELHGAHAGKRKKEQTGLAGVGATDKEASTVEKQVRSQNVDRDEGTRGVRGKGGREEGGLRAEGAEERFASAEHDYEREQRNVGAS